MTRIHLDRLLKEAVTQYFILSAVELIALIALWYFIFWQWEAKSLAVALTCALIYVYMQLDYFLVNWLQAAPERAMAKAKAKAKAKKNQPKSKSKFSSSSPFHHR